MSDTVALAEAPSCRRAHARSALVLAFCVVAFASCARAPAYEFDEAAPSEVGMDVSTLEGARAYAFADGRNTQSVLVVRRGTLVAEWYAEGREPEDRAASWSIGKSFTSAVVGIAIERGDIPSVDEPMTTYFPEFRGTDRESMTLRDVLQMASGIEWNESYDLSAISRSDIARLVISVADSHVGEVVDNAQAHDPGTVFNYSSGDTMLLSKVIRVATGVSAGEYARRHLFRPMGIADPNWWSDKSGDTLTYCCLDLRARDFAKFGQLFLEGGTLGGRRIVPEEWVRESLEPSPSYIGYGFQWWLTGLDEPDLPRDLYSARGHDGQYIYVIPSLELVVVRHGLYWPAQVEGDLVADPTLYNVYPSDGVFYMRGTIPPDSWNDVDFLRPILDSVID